MASRETKSERRDRRRGKEHHSQAARRDRQFFNCQQCPARKRTAPQYNYVCFGRTEPQTYADTAYGWDHTVSAAVAVAAPTTQHQHTLPAAAAAPPPRHALTSHTRTTGMDQELARLLEALQFREVTPEDYDVLLRLDESVKPK